MNNKALIDRLGESYLNKKCARCGSEDIAFFFEGTIAREVCQTGKDIVTRLKVGDLSLESRFYLCSKCAPEFAKFLSKFFEGGD